MLHTITSNTNAVRILTLKKYNNSKKPQSFI